MSVGDAPPFVSVAVSPASVVEDGPGTLTYTFSRTGVTTAPLTINITAAGTASANDDCTVAGAASFNMGTGAGTVTFAAGSATATVIVSPTEDTSLELDESVSLSCVTGIGYFGTHPSSATGTITGDDADGTVAVTPASV